GLIIISEDATGQPVAIMDSKWVTADRTAAASAVAAKHLARADARRLAILGCGPQGRKNLEVLKAVLPKLAHCQAYDLVAGREALFVRETTDRWGVSVVGAGSAERAVRGADIVITTGPIGDDRRATLVPEWLAPGSHDCARLRLRRHRCGHRRRRSRAHRRSRPDRGCPAVRG